MTTRDEEGTLSGPAISFELTAGSIAHDISNMAMVIQGSAELALRETPDGWLRDTLTEVVQAADGVSALCRTLIELSAASPSMKTRSLADMNECAQRGLRMARPWLRPGVRVDRSLAPGLPPVCGDEVRIAQVVFNLLVNAANAVRRRGTIEVKTRLEPSLDVARCVVRPTGGTPPRPFVAVEVSDDGPGLDVSVRRSLFCGAVPSRSGGHGLGLSLVGRLVQAHGGAIATAGSAAGGLSVRVFFPASSAREAHPLAGDP
jgi:two-component system nitrogen regulation sensor histidine kinase GlnL